MLGPQVQRSGSEKTAMHAKLPVLPFLVVALASAPVAAQPPAGDRGVESGDDTTGTDAASPGTDGGAAEEPVAEAAPPVSEEALRRFGIAVERADNGDCAAAIGEFEEIYTLLAGDPRQANVLFNMAVCFEELLRPADAMATYERYLEEAAPGADERREVERSVRRLDAMLATVTVESSAPASVWLDGRELGTAPGSFRVSAGEHTLELRAEGFETTQRSFTLASGVEETLRFELSALSDFRGISPTWTYAGIGLTGAAAAGGATAGILALVGLGSIPDERPVVEEDVEDVRDPALAADVLFGIAGAFAITTIVLIAVTDWDADDADDDVALWVGPGSIRLVGSF